MIAEHFGVPHIATGDLLRNHVARETELGRSVRPHLDRGELAPDEIVLEMVREAFVTARAAGGGYVLDGIPRNLPQARETYRIGRELGMTADVALHLKAEEEELVRRLLARAAVEGRPDDTGEVIRHRLAVYEEVTLPIVSLVPRTRHPGHGRRHAPQGGGGTGDPHRAASDAAVLGPRPREDAPPGRPHHVGGRVRR